jgi:hypothetical protein
MNCEAEQRNWAQSYHKMSIQGKVTVFISIVQGSRVQLFYHRRTQLCTHRYDSMIFSDAIIWAYRRGLYTQQDICLLLICSLNLQ